MESFVVHWLLRGFSFSVVTPPPYRRTNPLIQRTMWNAGAFQCKDSAMNSVMVELPSGSCELQRYRNYRQNEIVGNDIAVIWLQWQTIDENKKNANSMGKQIIVDLFATNRKEPNSMWPRAIQDWKKINESQIWKEKCKLGVRGVTGSSKTNQWYIS